MKHQEDTGFMSSNKDIDRMAIEVSAHKSLDVSVRTIIGEFLAKKSMQYDPTDPYAPRRIMSNIIVGSATAEDYFDRFHINMSDINRAIAMATA